MTAPQTGSGVAPGLPDAMRAAFREHPAGTAIVTARDAEGPFGLVVSSLASVCLAPPIVSLSVTVESGSGRRLARAESMLLHLVSAADTELATHFATPGAARFGALPVQQELPTGEPVLATHGARLRGRVAQRMAIGSSVLLLVELDTIDLPEQQPEPVVYLRRGWHPLG